MPNAIPPIYRSPSSELPAGQNSRPLPSSVATVSTIESMRPSSTIWDCFCKIFSWPKRMIQKLLDVLFGKEGNTINWEQKLHFNGISSNEQSNLLNALKKAKIDACPFEYIFIFFPRSDRSIIFFEGDGPFHRYAHVCNTQEKVLSILSAADNVHMSANWAQGIAIEQPTIRSFFQNRNKMVMLSEHELHQMTQEANGLRVPDVLASILETGTIPAQSSLPPSYSGLVLPPPDSRN